MIRLRQFPLLRILICPIGAGPGCTSPGSLNYHLRIISNRHTQSKRAQATARDS